MQPITIYHNPKCSTSRKVLTLLKEQGFEPNVVEYLKTPLNYEQLSNLLKCIPLCELVRTKETLFQELGLNLEDEQQVLDALVSSPKLMQRPIVTYQGKSVVGRPIERVLHLIQET